jgi:hypothetical protein
MGEPLSDNWKPPQLNLVIKPKPNLALASQDPTTQSIQPICHEWMFRQFAWPKEKLISWDNEINLAFDAFGAVTLISLALTIISTLASSAAIDILLCIFMLSMVISGALFGIGARPFKYRLRNLKERARLRAVRSWLKLHRQDIKALLARVSAFDQAIHAFNEIEERCADAVDEPIRIAAHEALEKQRKVLQAEVNSRIAELEGAEESSQLLLPDVEVAVKAEAKAARRAAKEARRRALEHERRASDEARRTFKERVKVWQRLDRGLAAGADNGRYDKTQDITPYVVAMQMRAKLEAECLELGLSPSELPEPTSALRLPAKAGG